LRFLKKNGSFLKSEADRFILDDAGAVRQYSSLMMRLSEYKCNASVNPFKGGIDGLKNLAMSTLNVDRHRVVNVARGTPVDDRGRADHHGLGMSQALGSMGVFEPHAQRPIRFFANKEHEKLFEKRYPTLKPAIRNLEGSGSQQNVKALRDAVIANANAFTMMDWMTQTYFSVYCERAKVLA
jgi:hypothetical protein